MSTEIKAPQFPESVADGTVATWHKKVGESVKRDELLVDIETDKVVLEVVAPADGVLKEIRKDEGDTVESQELLGIFDEGASADSGSKAVAGKADDKSGEKADAPADEEASAAAAGPAARKLMAEHGLDASRVEGSGKGGRITREDVEQALKAREQKSAPAAPAPAKAAPAPASAELPAVTGEREERRVPMTRLRKRVAERLVDAQHTAAILTTFNEVNMKPIMDMRKHYQADFEKTHGVRLGFMSFFVRA